MLEFNSRDIIVGYIKQLLISINLPCCKIFKNEQECDKYFSNISNLKRSRKISFNEDIVVIILNYESQKDYFIKIDLTTKKKEKLLQYRYNHFYPNLTKTIKIENDIYDTYTHTYLGDYLRFIRDYYNINLMSMYNCFANQTEVVNNFKFFVIPIKYGTTYTLFYSYDRPIEYNFLTDINDIQDVFFNQPSTLTISKRNSSSFPTITTNYAHNIIEYAKEKDLKLILKVPLHSDFPIVVLEGDYSKYQNKLKRVQINYERKNQFNNLSKVNLKSDYKFEENYTTIFNDNINTYNFQLVNKLKTNNSNNPIADRLIEYLLGNVITDKDLISKNIIDAKYKVNIRYLNHSLTELGKLNSTFTIMDRFKMLDAININKLYPTNKEDLLGYVDKDVESVLNDERF